MTLHGRAIKLAFKMLSVVGSRDTPVRKTIAEPFGHFLTKSFLSPRLPDGSIHFGQPPRRRVMHEAAIPQRVMLDRRAWL
jgi:hypothetical protein